MRYLGIDYGSKKVGLAISDESGRVAFPLMVVASDKELLKKISDICLERKIEKIICGRSVDGRGGENPIMKEAENFCQVLSQKVNLPIDFENEFLTSVLAGETTGRDEKLDAQAAALILQRYLDRKNS